MASLLERHGFEVIQSDNRKQALKIFSSSKCDLVVTDICIPESDGLKFLILLKSTDLEVPIIVLTGRSEDTEVDIGAVCRKLGAAAILEKPFRERLLFETIDSLLTPADSKGAEK